VVSTYPNLKNDGVKVSWDDDIPNIWKNKKCSKPPTSIYTPKLTHAAHQCSASIHFLIASRLHQKRGFQRGRKIVVHMGFNEDPKRVPKIGAVPGSIIHIVS